MAKDAALEAKWKEMVGERDKGTGTLSLSL
jgi:hypothetical protein